MQSPPLELVLDVVHLGTRNLVRARGEADEDTISEITRALVSRTPHGWLLFDGLLVTGGLLFRQHIRKGRL